MGRLGAKTLAWSVVTIVAVGAATGTGCSGKKATELVPGAFTQMVVPKDLKAIRIDVEVNGATAFCRDFDVAPGGVVQLPGTLGVVAGGSAGEVVTITIRGYDQPGAMGADRSDCQSKQFVGMVPGTSARIIRRSIQSFVDSHILFLPMPLSYSCVDTDCSKGGTDDTTSCKGAQCIDPHIQSSTLADFDPTLLDGTDLCFSPMLCFPPLNQGTFAAVLLDQDTCTYGVPNLPGLPTTSPGLNVRVFYKDLTWQKDGSGQLVPVLAAAGEQEILNEDADEGFTLLSTADAGLPAPAEASVPFPIDGGLGDAGLVTMQPPTQLFRLAPGLCNLVKAGLTPPAAATTRPTPTISDVEVANVCPPKGLLLPICAKEQENKALLPDGGTTSDGFCNVARPLVPTPSAVYLVMDKSQAMHGAFGNMGYATAMSLSLNDPVFKRTFAGFKFLPGNPADCTNTPTSFTTPDIPFGLAASVQGPLATQLKGWTMPDTASNLNPLDLQAAMRLDAGAYKQILNFLQTIQEPPDIAAAMFFVNRVPETGPGPFASPNAGDCNSPPLVVTPTTRPECQGASPPPYCGPQQAIENEIKAAFNNSPSLQTYFVVLDDDSHDAHLPFPNPGPGALTFFQQVQTDLPQAVTTLDATPTDPNAVIAAFSNVVTALGTCLYELPASVTSTSQVQVNYNDPIQGPISVPLAPGCSATTQTMGDGWTIDTGRLRICGQSCANLRQVILGAAGAAPQTGQPVPDVPVTVTSPCTGSSTSLDASSQ